MKQLLFLIALASFSLINSSEAQVEITLPGINNNRAMPVMSAQLLTATNSSGGRANASNPSGQYYLITRAMDSNSAQISTYAQKSKMIKKSQLKYILADGSPAVDFFAQSFINGYATQISGSGNSTETFKLFFSGRETK